MNLRTSLCTGLALMAGGASHLCAQTFKETFQPNQWPGIHQHFGMRPLPQGVSKLCREGQLEDPEDWELWFPEGPAARWGILVSNEFPTPMTGDTGTPSWAVALDASDNSKPKLFVHGTRFRRPGETFDLDQGFGLLTQQTFDPQKWLVARTKVTFKPTYGALGAWMGLTLINNESDYRAIYFISEMAPDGQRKAYLHRVAPCIESRMKDHGQDVAVPLNTSHTFQLEYVGSEGSWRYLMDGVRYDFADGQGSVEPASQDRAALKNPPRLGLYVIGPPQSDPYTPAGITPATEGTFEDVKVWELTKVNPIQVWASNGNNTSGSVIDGKAGTAWVSGVKASNTVNPYIALYFDHPANVRRIRLLPYQPVAGTTVHNIWDGTGIVGGGRIERVTRDGEWIEVDFLDTSFSSTVISIATVQSPSIVGWREIEVYEYQGP